MTGSSVPEFDAACRYIADETYDKYVVDHVSALLEYPRLRELLEEAGSIRDCGSVTVMDGWEDGDRFGGSHREATVYEFVEREQ